MGEKFEIIEKGSKKDTIGAGYGTGGVSKWPVKIKCPKCGEVFEGVLEAGCFHTSVSPETCPRCSYEYEEVGGE